MKKNVLLKSFLVLVLVSLLVFSITGCVPTPTPPPTTGTVYIYVYATWATDIYMDYIQQFNNIYTGTYTLYNVPIGSHFFEAIDDWGISWGYDFVTQYISAGANYVYLYP